MERQRIQVYANSELKRRIKAAAAKHNMPVTEYCLNAIQQQLADEDLLQPEQIEIQSSKKKDGSLIANLRELHQEILAYRNGELFNVDTELEQLRDERSYELTGLR